MMKLIKSHRELWMDASFDWSEWLTACLSHIAAVLWGITGNWGINLDNFYFL